jgi:hypothetical protein
MKFDLSQAEHCYILGFFWADCWFGINKIASQRIKKNYYEFSFEIKTNDFLKIWPILEKIGYKNFKSRLRKNSNNSQSSIRNAKQEDMAFFKQWGFDNKNNGCPLYFELTDQMKCFFIKGFLDGDGSISIDKNKLFRVGFNGHKDQNWNFLEHYCNLYDIQYVLYRKDRKKTHTSHTKDHGYSVLEFSDLQNRINLCKSLEHTNIGLDRKINIYNEFKNYRIQNQKINKALKILIF